MLKISDIAKMFLSVERGTKRNIPTELRKIYENHNNLSEGISFYTASDILSCYQ